jgi:hypothetical protein
LVMKLLLSFLSSILSGCEKGTSTLSTIYKPFLSIEQHNKKILCSNWPPDWLYEHSGGVALLNNLSTRITLVYTVLRVLVKTRLSLSLLCKPMGKTRFQCGIDINVFRFVFINPYWHYLWWYKFYLAWMLNNDSSIG